MKAKQRKLIDGLAKKAFESVTRNIPESATPAEIEYRLAATERARAEDRRRTTPSRNRGFARRAKDPFAIVACALALIMVIPSARGMARTAFADTVTAARESGRLNGGAEFMTMVFAKGGERFLRIREKNQEDRPMQ
jgi:hypothetical protein